MRKTASKPKQKKSQTVRLGVNIDHVATLRQVRGGTTSYPSIYRAAELAVQGGAVQITIHLREDRRHIQEPDLALLAKKLPVALNLEMAATSEMLEKALKYRPEWVCLVPEKREELTTEGGLNVLRAEAEMAKIVSQLLVKKSRRGKFPIYTSMFIEPDLEQVRASARIGARAVEFHTGHWVLLKGAARKQEWQRLVQAAKLAHELGLHVHAGHGLDFKSAKEITKLPYLEEVNIGHSLICYSIEMGLLKATREMKKSLQMRS